jgi:nifR3 family TIM-barrel protein
MSTTITARKAAVGSALSLGALEIDPPVVLAPMAGVTNAPFRRLCRAYGAGLYVSEMIAARALVEGNPKTLAMASFARDEPVRSVQLYAVDPKVAGDAVRRLVEEIGVDHLDLNFGCPVAKVTRLGGGAALPVHRSLFRSILRAAVRAAGAVPVTVKLRMGTDAAHHTFLESGRTAEDEGVAAVTLHARTAEQYYSGRAQWAAIAALKDSVSVPVLGNGDIWEASDAIAMTNATGCDGVVIGRGCLGRPWLFGELDDAFAGRPPRRPPALGEVVGIMRTHAQMLSESFGEGTGVRQFRKHAGWYLTGFPVGPAVRRSLGLAESLDEVDTLLDDLDPALPFPPEAARTRRGHTNGPRPVRLPDGWYADVDDPTPPAGGQDAVSGG